MPTITEVSSKYQNDRCINFIIVVVTEVSNYYFNIHSKTFNIISLIGKKN